MSAAVFYLQPSRAPTPPVAHDEPDIELPGTLSPGRGISLSLLFCVICWCSFGALIGALVR